MSVKWMIYGATGFTGKLIIEQCHTIETSPVLAGRDREKLKKLSEESGYSYRVFDLTNQDKIERELREFDFVVNVAGPFWKDIELLVNACINSHTDYIDLVAGPELSELHESALMKDVMLLPGVGFSIVPSDCLKGYLLTKCPDATHYSVFISGLNSVSRGTARGGFEIFKKGILFRRNGSLERVSDFSEKSIDFGTGGTPCIPMPWGEIHAAHRFTGIHTIRTYAEATKMRRQFLFSMKYLRRLFATSFMQKRLQSMVDSWPEGPDAAEMSREKSTVAGVIQNERGEQHGARIHTAEGYRFTAQSVCAIVNLVLSGKRASGYQLPGTLFGYKFVLDIEGVSMEDIKLSR